jgi:hypothetical protein
MTPPSTSRAEDAYAKPYVAGQWTCLICQPNVVGPGRDAAFARHYATEHLAARYDTPKPDGFVPVPRPDQQEAS